MNAYIDEIIRRFLGMDRDPLGREKFIVAKDVREAIADYAETKRFPTVPTGIRPVGLFMDIEVISHKDMPDGEMILVPYGMNEDVAVEIYLAQKKAKEKENAKP